MYYKEDWGQARKRFEAFWEGEIVDRCCIGVTAPRKGASSTRSALPNVRDDILKWWTDPESTLNRHLETFSSTFYGGEAFPVTEINLGASIMAAFFGSPPEFRAETVWYPKTLFDWETDRLEFDRASNPYYQIPMTSEFNQTNFGVDNFKKHSNKE